MNPIYLIFLSVLSAVVCGRTAQEKNRSVIFWVLFGALVPLVAIIVISLLKKEEKEV